MKKWVSTLSFFVYAVYVPVLIFANGAADGKAFPSKTVEIVAPASPGGGWDSTARAFQKVVKDNNLAPGVNIIVTNKPGGKGSVGWNYLLGKKGDGHYVAMSSSLIYLNELTGRSEQHYSDFTPVATLTNEWIATVVRADSEIATPQDLIALLKSSPQSVKIGIGVALGNDDHLSINAIAQAANVDPEKLKSIVYKANELIPNLLGGFVDFVQSGFVEVSEFHKSGDLRIIAISGDERYPAPYDRIPTWKESGVDVVFPHWRGMLGPPEMPAESVAWWNDLVARVVAEDDWKTISANSGWGRFIKNSSETAELHQKEFELYKDLLAKLNFSAK